MISAVFSAWSAALAFIFVVLAIVAAIRAARTMRRSFRHPWWQMLFWFVIALSSMAMREILLFIATDYGSAPAQLSLGMWGPLGIRLSTTVAFLGMIGSMTYERCGHTGWLWSFACGFCVFTVALLYILH